MSDPNSIVQLLVQLLQIQSPEFGARLKQRLNAALEEKGLAHFNERALGYKKFHEFLERAPGDMFVVTKPTDKGDIFVTLKSPSPSAAPVATVVHSVSDASSDTEQQPIRNEVWQAFSNPDVARRRFLHKKTHAVRHYIEGHDSPIEKEIKRDETEYIEIIPILGDAQRRWTAEFLKEINLPMSERSALDAMVAREYTSGINAAFTRALGDHGKAWRRYRTRVITETIEQWARDNLVPLDRLRTDPKAEASGTPQELVRTPPLSARDQAIKLLDLIAEEDISRLVLPTLLSTILIKSRL